MNYVELHIGDYEKATAHLTACEDGIYGRMIRRYYDTEAPLPLDLKAVQRLVRARTRDEKEAVETLLEEFFTQCDDGWHHKRCDEEIARYNEKREKAQRSAKARWNRSERNANASSEAMRTHSEGNAHQTPSTSHQSPVTSLEEQETKTEVGAQVATGSSPHVPLALCLRRAGFLDVTTMLDELREAARLGIDGQDLVAVAMEGRRKRKKSPGRWAVTTAIARYEAGEAIVQDGAHAVTSTPNKQQQLEDRNRAVAAEWLSRASDSQEDHHALD